MREEAGGEAGGETVDAAGGGGSGAAGNTSALAVRHRPAGSPGAAVVVLHGGREHSREASRGWHLAALRMRPVLRAAVAATDREDVLVAEVRYRYRGWNATADPVHDTVRALDELRRTVGEVPVTLVGHSMGGRAALRAAADPAVRGVLALAPWCPPGEPVDQLGGKRIVVLHGDRDRVTDPGESEDYVRRARRTAAQAGLVLVRRGDHAMLRRCADWHRATAAIVAQLLRPDRVMEGLAGEACAADGPLPW